MPKIGKRILKSSLAVCLCFLIYLLRNEQGIVFYSCIAAVLCVQQSTSNTIKVARNRVEGTLIGGLTGMLVLLFEKNFIPHDYILVQYLLVSFMIIPIIYTTVVLKKTSASYISCVVFMSITVSHAADVNPYMFAVERIIDTLIGIFVALFINRLHIPRRKDTATLFALDYDTLLSNDTLDSGTSIKLRQLIERGANIAVISDATPGVFMKQLTSFPIAYPIICMRGTFSYDIKTQKYAHCNAFSYTVYTKLFSDLKHQGNDVFVYSIIYDVLHIYYGELTSDQAKTYYEHVRRTPYENYVYGDMPLHHKACAMMFIIKQEDEQQTLKQLQNLPYVGELHIFSKSLSYDDSYIQIYITPILYDTYPIVGYMKKAECQKLSVLSKHEDKLLQNLADTYIIIEDGALIKHLKPLFFQKKSA